MKLNLFEDTTYSVEINTQREEINNITRIRGDMEGYDHSFVVLSIRDGEVSGTIEIPEENERFVVQNDPSSRSHYVSEVDLEDLEVPESSGEVIPENKENRTSSDTDSSDDPFQSEDPTYMNDESEDSYTNEMDDIQPMESGNAIIDVMVVYTSAADNEVSDIDQVISNSVGTGNTVFDNSEIDAELNLVHTAEVDYDESDNDYADRRRLTTSPTFQPWVMNGTVMICLVT